MKDENINYEVNQTDIRRIREDLNSLPDALSAACENYIEDIRDVWKFIGHGEAYDSGAYVHSIQDFQVSAYEFVVENVDPDVKYASVIEFGRRDQPNREPQFTAQDALDFLDNRNEFERKVDEQFDRILRNSRLR